MPALRVQIPQVAHAGMARLQMAIDMMTKAVNGEKLDKKELDHLRAVTPAPTVVFMQVRTQLLKFCGEALTELKNAKELSPASAPQQPVGFYVCSNSELEQMFSTSYS